MFLQIWFLPLSFVFSAALCLSPFLHLSSSPSSSPRFLSRSSMHMHTLHRHTQSQTLSLVVEFIVWSVSSFSPSVLPFVFCMFCCIVQRDWDADRMQTVCPGWRVRTSTLGVCLTKHIRLFTHDQMYKTLLFKHRAWGVFHQRDLMHNVLGVIYSSLCMALFSAYYMPGCPFPW